MFDVVFTILLFGLVMGIIFYNDNSNNRPRYT